MTAEATETQQYPRSVLETPEVAVPPRQTEFHRGEITGVDIKESQNGGVALQLSLTSLDTGGDDNASIWLPDGFVQFLANSGNPANFDPSTLPEEEGNMQLSSYRRAISNSDHDATLQVLTKGAVEQGRGGVLDGFVVDSFESYVEGYNKLLSGVQIIYTKRERKNEEGQKFFNVTNYFHQITDQDNPKMFKRGRKMWSE